MDGPESGIDAVQVEDIHFVIDLSPSTPPTPNLSFYRPQSKTTQHYEGVVTAWYFQFPWKFRDLAILLYLGSQSKSLLDGAEGFCWLQQEKMVRRVCHRVTTEKVHTGKPLLYW